MRRYTPRDLLVLGLIGLAVLYWLDPRILQQPRRLDQVIYDLGIKLLVLAVSITVHEFGHAVVAYKLGDPTPKDEGRVSLNPLHHLDPVGTFMILFGPIGWGKPVRWNPGNVDRANIRVALIAVSLAGIVMNLLLAFALYHSAVAFADSLPRNVSQVVARMISLNVGLAAYNILPIPPLDGYNFWLGVLPPSLARLLYPLNQYGFLILILLVVLPSFGGPDLLSVLIGPVITFFSRLVTGGFS
jgi:Zn-dependent protease